MSGTQVSDAQASDAQARPAIGTRSESTGVVRRNRTTLLAGLVVLLVLVAISIAGRDQARFGGRLDPRNPKSDGAQAVAKVLDQHGVEVQIVRGRAAFQRAAIDRDTTIVVTNPAALGSGTLREVRQRAAASGDLVLVGAVPVVTEAFGLRTVDSAVNYLPADCAEPLVEGLTVHAPDTLAVRGAGCFGAAGAVLLSRPEARVWLLSASEVLSNHAVLDADNAALALRLLGQHDHLLWYVADSKDTTAADAVTISSLLPRWLAPTLWTVAFSLLALLLWRGRRFGPLVSEPLPVVIRAAESTESRGRLYHRTRDRDYAAAILRRATTQRLGNLLALPADAPWPVVAAAAAARSGQPVEQVRGLLGDAEVPNDSRLAELGRDLLRLEAEVRAR